MDIRELLNGGDLRSIGHVEAVVEIVGNNPDRFEELMIGLTDDLVPTPASRHPTRSKVAFGSSDATADVDGGRGN